MSDIIVMDEEPNDEKDGCEIDGEKYVEDKNFKQVLYDEKHDKLKSAAVKNVEQTHYNKKHVKIKPTLVFTWRGWRQ